jgi:TRAP-type C4-dicarboxylate transport system permease small subunit
MSDGRSSGRIAGVIMRLDDFVLNITLIVCGCLLLAMVIIEALGVIFRFILHDSLSWSDELASYLFVWLTCLGAAAGIKLRVHPEVKALADRLPAITQPWLEDLTDVAIAALGAVFLIYGGEMLRLMGSETASSLPISMVYPYLAIPVGGILLILHASARIVVSYLSPCKMQSLVDAPEISKHI